MVRYFKSNITFPFGFFRWNSGGIRNVEVCEKIEGEVRWRETHFPNVESLSSINIWRDTMVEITEEEANTIIMMKELVS